MSEKKYDINGASGRHLDVYEEKVVLTVKRGFSSLINGGFNNGEKTIFFTDCIGIQYKDAGFITLGYLQFETSSAMMNNKENNFTSENSFIWEGSSMNKLMKEVANYCKEQVDNYKSSKYNKTVTATSPADELKKFKELLDMGAITQEEFNAKKKQILGL